MSRAQITLSGKFDRERAIKWITQAPAGTRVTFRDAKRTEDQNSKLWAMLTEVAVQMPWHGQKLTAEDWKLIFVAALKQEMRIVPNIDGNGFVNLGRSTSRLSKAEFSDLIEIVNAFAANHDVHFRNDPLADEAGQAA
jgi:hypothetical protein